jgi:hypothetical protein
MLPTREITQHVVDDFAAEDGDDHRVDTRVREERHRSAARQCHVVVMG